MSLVTSPFVKAQNEIRSAILETEFGTPLLTLWKYHATRPELYFNRDIASALLSYFEGCLQNHPELTFQVLSLYMDELDLAFRSTYEMNRLQVHEEQLEGTSTEKLLWLDQHLIGSYLKYVEWCLTKFLLPVAHLNVLKRSKSPTFLSAGAVLAEISRTPLASFVQDISPVIRNGIAHGGIRFDNDNIVFIDKSGQEERASYEFVTEFDTLVDLCNGLAFGYERLLAGNWEHFLEPSPSLFLEILRTQVDDISWKVRYIQRSTILDGEKQLQILVHTSDREYGQVQTLATITACCAASWIRNVDRYFLEISGVRGRYNLGWMAFAGPPLRRFVGGGCDIDTCGQEIKEALGDSGLVLFRSRKRHIFSKLLTLGKSFRIVGGATLTKFRFDTRASRIEVRHSKAHLSPPWSKLNASCVVHEIDPATTIHFIRNNRARIVRQCLRQASVDGSQIAKLVPLGFARVGVYSRSYRRRQVGAMGLPKELICMLHFQLDLRVQCPDILGGVPEQLGPYRLIWNQNWLDASRPDSPIFDLP